MFVKLVKKMVIMIFDEKMMGVWMIEKKRKNMMMFGMSLVGLGIGFIEKV